MFSKNKKTTATKPVTTPAVPQKEIQPAEVKKAVPAPEASAKAKPMPSIISTDLKLTGDIDTSGDLQVEGHIIGNLHAHLLTIGENALIEGEIFADDVTVHGKVKGTLRGLKVRLSSSARVEGDIIHKTISIESGAHFEGSVNRKEDPISKKQSTT